MSTIDWPAEDCSEKDTRAHFIFHTLCTNRLFMHLYIDNNEGRINNTLSVNVFKNHTMMECRKLKEWINATVLKRFHCARALDDGIYILRQ